MTNIALAACDGMEGDPGEFPDYHFRLLAHVPLTSTMSVLR